MMVSFSGQKGSGKTLSMCMIALLDEKKRKIVSNIPGLKTPHHLLVRSDMFRKVVDEKKSSSKTERYKLLVNWNFWKEHTGESIYIDEIHQLVYSRSSMSAENKAASMFAAQCRKQLRDTGDWRKLKKIRRLNNNLFSVFIYDVLTNEPNFYFNSQTTSKVDKDFRDLTDVHVHCTCDYIDTLGTPVLFIRNYFYFADHQYSAMDVFEQSLAKPKVAWFVGNSFFDSYDRFAITADDEAMI